MKGSAPFLAALLIVPAVAQAEVQYGIAGQFTKDEGLKTHPSVIFTEDFETGNWSNLVSRWGFGRDNGNVSFSTETPPLSSGVRSWRPRGSADLFTQLRPSNGKPGFDHVCVRALVHEDRQRHLPALPSLALARRV